MNFYDLYLNLITAGKWWNEITSFLLCWAGGGGCWPSIIQTTRHSLNKLNNFASVAGAGLLPDHCWFRGVNYYFLCQKYLKVCIYRFLNSYLPKIINVLGFLAFTWCKSWGVGNETWPTQHIWVILMKQRQQQHDVSVNTVPVPGHARTDSQTRTNTAPASPGSTPWRVTGRYSAKLSGAAWCWRNVIGEMMMFKYATSNHIPDMMVALVRG